MMMILLDYSQIALSNIIVQKLNDETMIRHMILNSIRMYNKRYREEYGQMVICADGMNTWRKEYFPEYKAHRKKARDNSEMDWTEIFRILHLVRDEIKENLPYKVLHMDGCEADDIIGTLAMQTQEFGMHEPVMIISSDKDFIQLQKFNNVKQFSPIQKKMVANENPRTYLWNHILRGDSGDGVPNVLSKDDTFVSESKQTPLRQTRIDDWIHNAERLREVMPEEIFRNYQRNKKLIDLADIPEDIQKNIINTFNGQKPPMRMKVLNYLIKKRCTNLIEVVEEFYNG
jgi:5'-3' exonuclease|tara:strand:+ start:767 stop:1627 length:861 start_codon:yes stop_codon:yes gene_type:complete